MLAALRTASFRAAPARTFSSSAARRADLAKLTLIGNLVREPEVKLTKNDKEFVTYTVATQNYPPPPPDANGERRPSTSTFHRVFSFHDSANQYLQNLKAGSKVYVEASFELKEPDASADPATPQGQRQIFLRHESIRVLNYPRNANPTPTEE